MSNNLYTLITGATGGIGKEFVQLYAKQSHNLILVAKCPLKLDCLKDQIKSEFPEIDIRTLPLDFSDSSFMDQFQQFFDETEIKVNYLINCSGYQTFGSHEIIMRSQIDKLINVNLVSVTLMTHFIYTLMVENNIEGRILNTSSTAAFKAAPYQMIYNSSKSFILRYTLALHQEAKNHNIKVTCLCPGSTRTPFFEKAGLKMPKHPLEPDYVAKYGFKSLEKNKTLAIPGIRHKVQYIVYKFLPFYFSLMLASYLIKRRR